MMKSESILRSLIINKINSGISEESARGWVSQEYPEQEGEIWTLELEKPAYSVSAGTFIKDKFVIDDSVQYDDLTEDLDTSILESDAEDEEEITVKSIEEVIEQPIKRKYNTNKRKMRGLFLESDDKSIGHITAIFMTEFKLNLNDAYNNALVVIADYDKKRFS